MPCANIPSPPTISADPSAPANYGNIYSEPSPVTCFLCAQVDRNHAPSNDGLKPINYSINPDTSSGRSPTAVATERTRPQEIPALSKRHSCRSSLFALLRLPQIEDPLT